MTLLLRLAVPALLLAAVWVLFDGPAALARLGTARWPDLLAALTLIHAQTVLSALRWRLTAARLGMPMSARHAIGEYYLTQFVNQTLPGGVLGDAARAVRARAAAGLRRSGAAVVIERLAGQAALLAVTGAGFALAPVLPGAPAWPTWSVPLGLAVLTLPLLLARLPAPPRLAGSFAALRAGLLDRAVWPAQAALGLGIVVCNLGAFAFASHATGTPLPPTAVVTLIPLILFAMLLPVSIAGWGWREGAAAALFPLTGAPPEAGLAASVAFGLLLLAAALPGAFWLTRPAPGA